MNGEGVTSTSWDGVEGRRVSWLGVSSADNSLINEYSLTGHDILAHVRDRYPYDAPDPLRELLSPCSLVAYDEFCAA